MIDICKELSQNFLDFSYEANSQRAFPDARDGLKPGQRACLWEMYEKGYTSNKPHVKSAKISGGVIASWWPHGSTAIYETFARMSQPWINNNPEVDWHGANGSIIMGSQPAADRYTEARLSKITEDGMFCDIDKKNVSMIKNFSEDAEWPEALPAIFPRLMVNGSQGIGVTISNSWLCHSLTDIANVISNYVSTGNLNYDDLYPDFPTGGTIINKKDINTIYATGKGKAIVRGKAIISKNEIIITELPYQVFVEPYLEEIKELLTKDELPGIIDAVNESGKNGLRIRVICDKNPQTALNYLYAKTSLQKSFNANQWALVGKTPELLNLQKYCDIYIAHNIECIKKACIFDKQKASERKHVVDGLLICLEDIDEVIKIIKTSQNSANAKTALISKYKIDDKQATSVLDMKLARLAHLEKIKLEEEQKTLTNKIQELKEIIESDQKKKDIFIERLNNLVKKYGTSRKTDVIQLTLDETKPKKENLIPPEECVVILTEAGTIQRVPSTNFKVQKRNGKGVKTPMDITKSIIRTNTVDSLLVFSDKGKLYKLSVNDIPVDAKNVYLKNLTNMEYDENPVIIYSLYKGSQYKYILFATKQGLIKRTPIEEYVGTRKKNGIAAIKLRDGDELAAATLMTDEEVLLVSSLGHVIRIDGNQISIYSKTASGIKGIKLDENDEVLTALPIRDTKDDILLCFEDGRGKRIPLDLITKQNRGGVGQKFASSKIIGTALVNDNDALLVIGKRRSICIKASDIKQIVSRQSEGVALIKDDKITSVSKV